MPDKYKQFTSNDGCVYLFDIDKEEWLKCRPVDSLPQDVKKQIRDDLKEMCAIAGSLAESILSGSISAGGNEKI